MGKKKPATKAAAEASSEAPAFEQMLERLEAIVDELEGGELGLSEALAKYEEGVGYLKRCFALLERAERKVELLAGVDAEGRPVTAPFDEQSMTLEEKRQARSRRRSRDAGGPPSADLDTPEELF